MIASFTTDRERHEMMAEHEASRARASLVLAKKVLAWGNPLRAAQDILDAFEALKKADFHVARAGECDAFGNRQ